MKKTLTKRELELVLLEIRIQVNETAEILEEFKEHLLSSKFHNDPTIQTTDVLRWLLLHRSIPDGR